MTNVSFELYVARAYQNKVQNAYSRGIDFQLSLGDMYNILSKNKCFYCGVEMTSPPYSLRGGVPQDYKILPTDRTIERIDSCEGYFPENCTAACSSCNSKKGGLESCPERRKNFDIEAFKREVQG